jgi:hypothetical protein
MAVAMAVAMAESGLFEKKHFFSKNLLHRFQS